MAVSNGGALKSKVRSYARQRREQLRFRLANPGRYAFDVATASISGMFGSRGAARMRSLLLVSDGLAVTSEEQYHPFAAFRSLLRKEARIVSAHLMVEDVVNVSPRLLSSFDAIGLKLSFRTAKTDALRVVERIREIAGTRPVIYFDGDDDLCVSQPMVLPLVDLYVKKHLFSDRRDYLKSYVGKSNLTDYVHRRFGVSFADDPYAAETQPVPEGQIGKLIGGWNLALDSGILALYSKVKAAPPRAERGVDLMFRGGMPKDWMGFLRNDIGTALERLRGAFRVIAPTERVSKEEYYREMMVSKICLSPFGYGEICWRDFEAILCGCLVIKPDMEHVRTSPNIFQPDVTYVPVRWDYSDLEERCARYLSSPEERMRITSAAFKQLEDYYQNRGFLQSLSEILRRVGLGVEASA